DFSPLSLGVDRPARAFVCPHGPIGVHPHDQRVAESARRLKVAHVTGMEQVVDAVGEDNRLAGGAQLFDEELRFGERRGPVRHLAGPNSMYVPTSARGYPGSMTRGPIRINCSGANRVSYQDHGRPRV